MSWFGSKPRGPSKEERDLWKEQTEASREMRRLGREQWDMYREHYETIARPRMLEGLAQLRGLSKEVENWASPGRLAMQEDAASDRVRTAYDNERRGLVNTLGRYGMNPGDGRFAGALRSLAMGSAQQQAGARNATRTAILDRDLTNRFNLANMWQGGQTPLSGMGTLQAAQQGLSGVSGQMAQSRMAANQAQAQQEAGFFQGLGALGGSLGGAWILR